MSKQEQLICPKCKQPAGKYGRSKVPILVRGEHCGTCANKLGAQKRAQNKAAAAAPEPPAKTEKVPAPAEKPAAQPPPAPAAPADPAPPHLPAPALVAPAAPAQPLGAFERIAADVGKLVAEKNAAYGDSFATCGEFLKLLYPDGIKPDQYVDALALVRVWDKQKRIATRKDAFNESPWRDLAGYGVLGVANDERRAKAS